MTTVPRALPRLPPTHEAHPTAAAPALNRINALTSGMYRMEGSQKDITGRADTRVTTSARADVTRTDSKLSTESKTGSSQRSLPPLITSPGSATPFSPPALSSTPLSSPLRPSPDLSSPLRPSPPLSPAVLSPPPLSPEGSDPHPNGHPIYAVSFETPLSAGSVQDMKQWMAAVQPGEVNDSYAAVLDQLSQEASRGTGASTAAGATHSTNTVTKALNFFLGSQSSTRPGATGAGTAPSSTAATHRVPVVISPTAAPSSSPRSGATPSSRRLQRISMRISPPQALTTSAQALLDAGYPDVRLSSHVLTFGPEHYSDPARSKTARGSFAVLSGLGLSSRSLATGDRPNLPREHSAGHPLRRASASGPLTGAAARMTSPPSTGPAPMRIMRPCQLNEVYEQELVLSNVGRHPANVNIRPLQAFVSDSPHADVTPSCFIQTIPTALSIKKGQSATVKVQITLFKPGTTVEALIAIEVLGGLRLMAMVRACSERIAFGIRPQQVPLMVSNGLQNIPVPLALLRKTLIAKNAAGLRAETVFRLQPANDEIRAAKALLDDRSFDEYGEGRDDEEGDNILPVLPCSPITAAHMIKVFLRELPEKILSTIPTEVLLGASTVEEYMLAVDTYVVGQPRTILLWLVDLLAETATYRLENKMDARALSVCTGPNLFEPSITANPMVALMTSQKAVGLLEKLINAKLSAMGLETEIAPPAPIPLAGLRSVEVPDVGSVPAMRERVTRPLPNSPAVI